MFTLPEFASDESAPSPTAVLPPPVCMLWSAPWPTAVLLPPPWLRVSAPLPTAVLVLPLVLDWSAAAPTAVLSVPVVVTLPACGPRNVLLVPTPCRKRLPPRVSTPVVLPVVAGREMVLCVMRLPAVRVFTFRLPVASRLASVFTVARFVAVFTASTAPATLLALLLPTVDTTVAAWVPVTSPPREPLKFVALSAVPARKANGSVVSGVRGVSSGSAPTVMPRKSGPPPWNRDGGSGVFWPRATVNSPFVAVTVSASVYSALPPLAWEYSLNCRLKLPFAGAPLTRRRPW